MITLLCLAIVQLLALSNWHPYANLIHIGLDSLSIFMALLSFILIWNIRSLSGFNTQVIGFGLLLVAILNALHILYLPSMHLTPYSYVDLSASYAFLSRFALALLLFVSFYPLPRKPLNDWWALIISLALFLYVSGMLYFFPYVFPSVQNTADLALPKTLLQILIVGLLLYTLLCMPLRPNTELPFANRHLFLALLFLATAEICLAFYSNPAGPLNLFALLLHTSGYYCIYKGIMVHVLTSPHHRLQRQAAHNSDILNGLPMGIMTTDNQYRITFANQEALDILGSRFEDLAGASIHSLTNRFRHGNNFFRLLDQQIRGYNSSPNPVPEIRTPRGDRLRLKIETRPLESGGYLCLFTPAKREQELKNLQLQTRTILDSVNDLVILTDKRGLIVTCNRSFEENTGLKKDTLSGKHLNQVVDSLQVQLNKPLFPATAPVEGRFVSLRDKKEKSILFQTSPVQNVDHETMGYLICATDVTAFKNELQEIREQEKLALVGQMAAGIVHEIKNPLTTIKGFSQFLKIDTLSWSEVRQYAEIIEGTVDDLNRVIMDFLSFARPRAPILQPVYLNELILSVQSMLDGHLFIKGIDVVYCFCEKDMMVTVDSGQFKQVLLNLVKNAVEAVQHRPEPRIKVATGYDQENRLATVQIIDNGKGMLPAELERLGIPFFTTKESGTGLGLSICYQIIKEHNGRIEVDSRPGQGTVFTIFLPCDVSQEKEWPLTS